MKSGLQRSAFAANWGASLEARNRLTAQLCADPLDRTSSTCTVTQRHAAFMVACHLIHKARKP